MAFTRFASHPARLLQAACLALMATALGAQERPVVSLQDFAAAEVRQQGFSLPRPMRVHVYARGGGVHLGWDGRAGTRLFAAGWILDAASREVVWQMDGATTRREGDFRIADRYLDLPAGRYEAYFADYGFGERLLFGGWIRNIDRRDPAALAQPKGGHSLLGVFGLSREGAQREWRRRAGWYGLQISVPAAEAAEAGTFPAPQRWRNTFLALAADRDDGRWTQAFRLRRPVAVHIYAEGEASGRRMVDTGWIREARTRKVVWEMTAAKARYAGGAEKNRRQVEVLQLPAGDYVAAFATDDSHSPADWNAQPPCDPGLYGLTLSVPADGDLAAVSLIPEPAPGPVLAELVRVKDDQDLRAPFTLKADQAVRIYAIGERDGDEMADGEWNADRPWDPEHYGATVYGVR